MVVNPPHFLHRKNSYARLIPMTDPEKVATTPEGDASGHRQRLKERYDRVGLSGLASHEVLELLLTYVIPRRDVKVLARRLLNSFRDLPGVCCAQREHLLKIEGIGPEAARFLNLVKDLGAEAIRGKARDWGTSLACPRDIVGFLKAELANLPEELFMAIFVDHGNKVLAFETMSHGVEDQTAVYPRKVMKRALALHATGLAVAHNHPTGNLTPSPADREITRQLIAAAQTLEIRFLDHVIIGRDGAGYFSFRENGLLN